MTIYHVEGIDQDYVTIGEFITTNFENALYTGKKMYEQRDIDTVYLNYWENECLIDIRVIDKDGKLLDSLI